MELAGKIYEEETGKTSPYVCSSKYEHQFKPLWFENDDIGDKAEWIFDRILECRMRFNNHLPTIAIFTKDKETGEKLKYAFEDCEKYGNDILVGCK